MTETGIRRSRVALFVFMMIAPIFGTGVLNIILMVAASLTAYDGLHRSTVYSVTTALIGIELIYGMDVGVLSVSYIVAILILMLMGSVVAMPTWTMARGWSVADALRTFGIAYALAVMVSVCTVLVGRVLYGYGEIGARLSIIFISGWGLLMPIGIALILVVLRRIDEPFRRRIIFGT